MSVINHGRSIDPKKKRLRKAEAGFGPCLLDIIICWEVRPYKAIYFGYWDPGHYVLDLLVICASFLKSYDPLESEGRVLTCLYSVDPSHPLGHFLDL